MKSLKTPSSWPRLANLHTIVFDFDGVFTDNKVYLDPSGTELVRCDRGDGLGIGLLHKARERQALRADMMILSTEENPVVLARARKLRLPCVHGEIDKLRFLENAFRDRFPQSGDSFSGLAYLGNDLNDLPAMRRAGFSCAPADAHPLIKEIASVVLESKGGEGFVREFVERLLGPELVKELTR
jgi:3-deoxy-D-manno-octulosonate 8-phosphate phosphatase (KDO 8-P phosphatase)